MRKLIALAAACLLLLALCKRGPAIPDKDFLSPSWAVFMSRFPGGQPDLTAAEQELAKQRSAAAAARARELYLAKNDTAALPFYEEAISNHATGQLYYDYANSLSNVRLDESVKAYQIALDLRFDRPELAFYNMACAYSRMGDMEKAFGYMALAISRGYNAFEYIRQDPDLVALRKVADWEEKIRGRIPAEISYSVETVAGTVKEPGPRGPTFWHLCRNGHYWSYSTCGGDAARGRWEILKGDLVLRPIETCVRSDPAGRYRGAACPTGDVFGGCALLKEDRSYVAFEKTRLSKMISGTEKAEPYRMPPAVHGALKDEKICDPSWRPASLADLDSLGGAW